MYTVQYVYDMYETVFHTCICICICLQHVWNCRVWNSDMYMKPDICTTHVLYTIMYEIIYITKNLHLSIHIQIDKYQYTHFHKHTHTCIYTHVQMRTRVCVRTNTCTHTCMCACVSVGILRLTFWDSPYFQGELQCVAVCCSLLQSVAVCCSLLLFIYSTYWLTFEIRPIFGVPSCVYMCVICLCAVHTYTYAQAHIEIILRDEKRVAASCSELQWVAVSCSELQWVAVCCSVLQSVAVCILNLLFQIHHFFWGADHLIVVERQQHSYFSCVVPLQMVPSPHHSPEYLALFPASLVCVYENTHAHARAYKYMKIYSEPLTSIPIYMWVGRYIYIYMYLNIYIYMYIYMYMYKYICIYTYVCMYIYICICIYIDICI